MCLFFTDAASNEIYSYRHTLSLHDALPIEGKRQVVVVIEQREVGRRRGQVGVIGDGFREFGLTAWAAVVGRCAEAFGGIGHRRGWHDRNRQPAPVVGAQRRRVGVLPIRQRGRRQRSEEHTSELQSLMRTSYAVFCLKKKKTA